MKRHKLLYEDLQVVSGLDDDGEDDDEVEE